ncbi:MAG: proton-conducting transporter membrane subunit [Desulfobulbaceae bacterium]|nr:proton-conducting transporter membrane subunit [Desulfobulbaceae bacterium]
MNLYFIIGLPFIAALVAAVLPSERFRPLVIPVTALFHIALVFKGVFSPELYTADTMLGLDALGRLVLLVISLLFAASSLYAVGYFRTHPTWGNRTFIACLLIFLGAMSLSTAARNLGLLWVAVEATTVVSAPLIYYNRNRFSIEATWKYLLLCSVGIALAMLGLLFVAYAGLKGGEEHTLQIDQMLTTAGFLSKPWLRTGFVFLLVGFGTKMGLAPLHTWKPDAYGEAPGLVGGLLAGGLTSVAFLAILRAMQIMTAAGEQALAHHFLLALGLLSLVFAALFVIRQRDIKRMLAYSSVEHMGILAIGLTMGKLAAYGAMFHVMNNALTKGALFMCAGNIHRYFGSKRMCETQGAINVLPWSASLLLIGFLAITGSPPFGPFMSEFIILRGIFAAGNFSLGFGFILLLTIIFIGMSSTVITVVLGPSMEGQQPSDAVSETFMTVLGPLLLIIAVLVLGLYLPEPLRSLFQEAADLVVAAQ